MKPLHHTPPDPVGTTLSAISRWQVRLNQLHQRLRSHFARLEPHQHAWLYLQAVLSEIPRKNGWQIAEHVRQPRPYGMQRLLSRATWDDAGVRDELRAFVCQTLQPPPVEPASADPTALFPVLILDESGFPKRGRHSAGVGAQYCGRTGRVENCQVGVFLSYVTQLGHALIDRELYLPEDWCADLPRRQAAHIPDSISFRTKPELAQHMVQRAQEAHLPIHWVVADTVYGHSPDLRAFLEAQGFCYALAVPSTEVVCVQRQQACLPRDVGSIPASLRARDWHRLSQSQGTKGDRLFDWAILPWAQARTVDGQHFLVIRRCLDDPNALAYYLVFTSKDVLLSTIVQAIGARWHIEEDLQTCKRLGLDQYEVRSFVGWYRHLTLVLLAAAFLVGITVQESHLHSAHDPFSASSPLIELTPSEVRHLLARLIFPAPTSVLLICQWSRFRRAHQYWAGYYHRRRRAKAS